MKPHYLKVSKLKASPRSGAGFTRKFMCAFCAMITPNPWGSKDICLTLGLVIRQT